MNGIDRVLLNKVHIFLAECYENKTIIPPNDIVNMFGKIFKGDITYIKHCPDGLENTLMALVKDINENPSNSFKESLKVLLTSYYDTIRYQQVKETNMPARDKDKFWYKSIFSQYVLEKILFRDKNNALDNFKVEYNQLGTLISQYYTENEQNKLPVIRNMIKSKIDNMFYRYNYRYDLPSLCA